MRPDDWLRVLYLLLWLLLIVGNFQLRRLNKAKTLRYALLWITIIGGLVMFYELMRSL